MKKIALLTARLIFIISAFLITLTSCEKQDDDPKGEYENGAFIVNEGNFGDGNGSVSFYSYDNDNVTNNIFNTVNGRMLGDVVQSLTLHNDEAYIIVNASNKIEVANRYTFEELGVIEDVPSPRYMVANGNKGYVSCWGDNTVKIIDLNSMTVTGSVETGSGPEKMVVSEEKLFVVNSGGWAIDSTITVIDLNTEEAIAAIPVKYSPKDIEIDESDNLWVLCYGKQVMDWVTYEILEETPSKVYKIDGNSNSVVSEIELFEDQHPSVLEIDDDDVLYFGGGYSFDGIYSLEISGTQATGSKIINEFAYGFAYDKNSDMLFVTIAPDYVSAGTLKRYTTEGALQGTYSVGIGPSGATFKRGLK